jgi:lipopolysaccharide transport system permease protein
MSQSAIPHPTVRIRARSARQLLSIRELIEFKSLFFRFAKRDVILRYRQTALGVSWVVLQPLLASGILSFVFGTVAKLSSNGVPYFPFAFAGFLGWNAFSSVITKSTGSLVSNSSLVSKVYFPRILLPLSVIGSTLVDAAVGSVVMVVLLLIYGLGVSWTIVFVPFLIMGFVLLAAGIGCITAALAVPYRDVAFVVPVMTQLLLYGSPIAYATSEVPASVRAFVRFNPLTGYLDTMRWALLPKQKLDLSALVSAGGLTVLLVLVGLAVFSAFERQFADVI